MLKTPQGYGVLIAMHAPERFPVKDLSYAKFFQEPVIYSVSCNSEMTVLTDMVDAFIGRKAITRTYKNLNGAVPASVTLNADFSHANPDTEFIAYMCGHFHIDAVSFVPGTEHKQLLLELTTSNSWTGMQKLGYSGTDNPFLAEFSDIRRAAGTPASDSFNVYTIDRTDKAVNIIRIGANMPSRMDGLRDYMRIPYADQ